MYTSFPSVTFLTLLTQGGSIFYTFILFTTQGAGCTEPIFHERRNYTPLKTDRDLTRVVIRDFSLGTKSTLPDSRSSRRDTERPGWVGSNTDHSVGRVVCGSTGDVYVFDEGRNERRVSTNGIYWCAHSFV